MASLNPKTVKNVISSWNILFGGNRSAAEQAVICAKFFGALQSVYDNDAFILAAEMVEKETRFFPTIKDMMDVRGSVNQVSLVHLQNMERKALPEETDNLTPEEIEQNLRKIEIIKDLLCGRITEKEAIRLQYELIGYVLQAENNCHGTKAKRSA